MEKKELTHEESLQIIQNMIDKAKNKMSENGFHFILWGILVITASLTQYFLAQSGFGNESNIVWIIMPLIGAPVGYLYELKRAKRGEVKGYDDKAYNWVWLGFGIALTISIFIAIKSGVGPIPAILTVVGLATFVSGALYRFNLLFMGGMVFWLAAVAATFVGGPEQLLINAGATFIGYIIPGIALWNNYKKNTRV